VKGIGLLFVCAAAFGQPQSAARCSVVEAGTGTEDEAETIEVGE
jgi:hypothetical protein